jgi:hypothetical protein
MTLHRCYIVGEKVKASSGVVDRENEKTMQAVLPKDHETVMFRIIGLFS